MPLLMLSRRTLDTTGQPIEFVRSLYRGDRYRFQTGLRRPEPAPPEPAAEERPVRVRMAVEGDAPAMASVFIEAWRGGYRGIVADEVIDAWTLDETTTWFSDLLVEKSAQTLVAESSPGKVVGFVRFGNDPDDPANGHVFALYVAPSAGGRGVGRTLLDKALTVLDPLANRAVTLWVFEDNARARSLYAHAGFEPDGERRVEEEFGAQEIHLRRSPAPAGAKAPGGTS
jgi:ribosomal protein S18 acetylase RimI-like enzyme